MTLRRLLANLLAGLVLITILVGLVFIIIDEKCGKHESSNVRARWTQAVPFGGGRR